MNKNTKKFLQMSMWITIIILLIRCFISWGDLNDTLRNQEFIALSYSLFGFIGESIGIGAFLMFVFEKVAWKWKPFKYLHNMPVLSINYEGKFISNFDKQERDMTLSIHQTFLKVKVEITTNESNSGSLLSEIKDINGMSHLVYIYQNNPKAIVRERSPMHYGTAMLRIINPKTLSGDYFTDRETSGTMDFKSIE